MSQAGLPMGVLNFPGLTKAGNVIYDRPEQMMRQKLAEALLSPKDAAALMKGAVPSAKQQKLLDALRMSATPALTGATTGLLNAQQ